LRRVSDAILAQKICTFAPLGRARRVRAGLHAPRSARLGGDPVFHQGDDRGQNGAGNAAAGELPDQGADIDRAAGLCKGRNQGRQQLSADPAANCACNRVSGGAQAEFL
jgi:hypothetical protein